ncbi:MAG: response regulator transcription factor [Bacteroidales bacterium]|nr:response regulator transcription factor [Bacteroidales bacterium]MDY4512524.1 response regulator transcription factor [Paludibacteraceae bacterium]MCI7429891.1 response regulator transcription factor [Bacteroidales bacterium]MDD6642287.1 response regulator transcription factor [Bacteroidales bacterium]MDD6781954.1 response regulator transcription factor [Bacteroidales bacterium]
MMANVKVLLCEDDENLGMLLREYLQAKEYDVDLMPDGEEGAKAFAENRYDLCILDVMMPQKDGFTLAQEIRHLNSRVPIIFLTAKTLKEDVLAGFKIGADDYMTKPFSMEELLFRIEAILRRTSNKKNKVGNNYKFGRYEFDTQKQTITIDGVSSRLTTKESELLGLLAQNMNNVLERNFALKAIWVEDNYFNARSMDVYITKLRKKLADDPDVQILNVHGRGYKLVAPEQKSEQQ